MFYETPNLTTNCKSLLFKLMTHLLKFVKERKKINKKWLKCKIWKSYGQSQKKFLFRPPTFFFLHGNSFSFCNILVPKFKREEKIT